MELAGWYEGASEDQHILVGATGFDPEIGLFAQVAYTTTIAIVAPVVPEPGTLFGAK